MTDTAMETIKTIVADKEQLISALLKYLDDSAKSGIGLEKAKATVERGSDANVRKMLITTMKILQRQQDINAALLSVIIMLASTEDFTQWQARFAMKTGANPQDVLRKMLKDKLGGVA